MNIKIRVYLESICNSVIAGTPRGLLLMVGAGKPTRVSLSIIMLNDWPLAAPLNNQLKPESWTFQEMTAENAFFFFLKTCMPVDC